MKRPQGSTLFETRSNSCISFSIPRIWGYTFVPLKGENGTQGFFRYLGLRRSPEVGFCLSLSHRHDSPASFPPNTEGSNRGYAPIAPQIFHKRTQKLQNTKKNGSKYKMNIKQYIGNRSPAVRDPPPPSHNASLRTERICTYSSPQRVFTRSYVRRFCVYTGSAPGTA